MGYEYRRRETREAVVEERERVVRLITANSVLYRVDFGPLFDRNAVLRAADAIQRAVVARLKELETGGPDAQR